MATVRANKQPEGYLFAIVNSLDTVVQLGIKISAASHNSLNISLVYNDPTSNMPSESLAIFTLPYEPKHWINFAIQVLNDKVSLYNNCIKTQEINVTKEPKELVFESASTFYLAQSGNLRHRFEVSTVFFSKRVYWNLSLNTFLDEKIIPRVYVLSTAHVTRYYCLPGVPKQLPRGLTTHALWLECPQELYFRQRQTNKITFDGFCD